MSAEATATATELSAGRPAAARPPKCAQRSAITNGSRLLPGVDGHSPWVRRAKDLISRVARRPRLRQRVRGRATPTSAGPIRFAACSRPLGLERRQKDVGPTLSDLLREDQAREAACGTG